jgi:hemerythrin superfamily protein
MANGIDLLLADHRRVEDLFAKFDETRDGTIVGEILDALTAHDYAEHAALYPLSAALTNNAALIQRLMGAHSEVKKVIEHLRGLEGAPLVDAVGRLKAAITKHVADEEKNLFPALEKIAMPAQLDELGARVEHAKQRGG